MPIDCQWMRRLLILFFLLARFAGAAGASPETTEPVRFMHLTVEDGLSQNTVRAILQDRIGFLWFATEEGLNRYDGYTFRVFKRNRRQAGTLPDDMVTALCEDRSGRLWVGTVGGLSVFDPRTETF